MTDYSKTTPPVAPLTGVADRVQAIARIMPVEPTAPQADARADQGRLLRAIVQPAADATAQNDEQARSHADYAKVHAEIATILSNFDAQPSQDNADTLAQAQYAMAMLLPQPSIVLPLPPASDAMVTFINQVRQSIVTQAARTRAAMSNVTSATVDAAIA